MTHRPACAAFAAAMALTLLTLLAPQHAFAFGPAPTTVAAASASGSEPASVASAADLERQGEELFGRNCQLCHNSRGKGGKGPSLVKGAWGPGGANSDEFMFNTIKHGRPKTQMGGFEGQLSDDEIRVIVAFLRAESVRVKASERKTADADYVPW